MGKRTSARPFVASSLTFSPLRNDIFMIGGQDALHVWRLDMQNKRINQTAINLGKIRRNITSLMVSHHNCRCARYEKCNFVDIHIYAVPPPNPIVPLLYRLLKYVSLTYGGSKVFSPLLNPMWSGVYVKRESECVYSSSIFFATF